MTEAPQTKIDLPALHQVHTQGAFRGWLQCVPSATVATGAGPAVEWDTQSGQISPESHDLATFPLLPAL